MDYKYEYEAYEDSEWDFDFKEQGIEIGVDPRKGNYEAVYLDQNEAILLAHDILAHFGHQ